MAYNVRPLLSFEKSLAKLDKQVAGRVLEKLNSLAQNPDAIGTPMSNLPKNFMGLHKIRIGDWRVFFWVDHKKEEIAPYLVDHRDNIYKWLYRKNK